MSGFREIIRYGLCGGITTLINLVLFYFLAEWGIYYLLANAIAYYIAVIINFYLNYYFVFAEKTKEKTLVRKLWEFCLLRTASLGIDTILFFALVSICGMNRYIGRILLSIAIILFNFAWSKKKIFT